MKKYLLTGLVILLPVALTAMVIIFLFDFLTAPFVTIVGPLVDLIPYDLPPGFTLFLSRLFALIFLCIFILLLGVVTRWFIVKNLLHWGHLLISRIPIVKTIYKITREIFNALFSTDGKKAFKNPVAVPFPERPNFCVGFHAGEVPQECQQKVKEPLISVFVPTAPHPISGFLLLMPKQDVYPIDMTNEEAFKFLVSCGLILPDKEIPNEF
ncbi:MAG TPA: DUF502 domain-containing protein [Chlamydiales bacterium]|nr:DUF502 domain-containing protein [Chlamydiales bacterium]